MAYRDTAEVIGLKKTNFAIFSTSARNYNTNTKTYKAGQTFKIPLHTSKTTQPKEKLHSNKN